MTVWPASPIEMRRADRSPVFLLLVVFAFCLTVLPLVGLAVLAFGGGTDDLAHLAATVLPGSILITAQVMTLVAILTGTVGVVSAWLIISFDFPLRRTLAWMLILPVAMPAYIASYSFVEFFHFAGPVQTAIRDLLGYKTNADYWFPDIRSVGGAGFILSAVLYPYVYLSTRVVFLLQGRNAADVARSLGAGPGRVFTKVAIPMARPAIAAGIALALMETLNDIGAVEYLGVRTLTFSVYNTWLARGSLAGAAQIALIMMIVVFALLALESHARKQLKFTGGRASHFAHSPARRKLSGLPAMVAMLACMMPVLVGFGIPFSVLLGFAMKRLDQLLEPAFGQAFANSILTGTLTATITVTASLFLMHAGRTLRSRKTSILLRLASMGYAVPGTVLAIGLVFMLGVADRWVNSGFSALSLPTPGLLFSGSLFAVVLAACIRFLAVADSGVHSGLSKLPPNIDHAARNLGRSPHQAMMQVMLPLLQPAVLTSLVLVFVDTVKELSATILLRPIGFNTLATLTYESASRSAVEDGSVAALAIVFVSLVPVLILSRALASDRVA